MDTTVKTNFQNKIHLFGFRCTALAKFDPALIYSLISLLKKALISLKILVLGCCSQGLKIHVFALYFLTLGKLESIHKNPLKLKINLPWICSKNG